MRTGFALTIATLLLASDALAASAQPASREWNARRADLWTRLCASTAPSFRNFAAAARRNGFRQDARNRYSLPRTEIVASLKQAGGRCLCLFTFGSEDHRLAVELLIQKMQARFPGRFEAGTTSRALGTLATAEGRLRVEASGFTNSGGQWMGITIEGADRCP